MKNTFNRRDVLKVGTALTATALFAEPIRAAAPPAGLFLGLRMQRA